MADIRSLYLYIVRIEEIRLFTRLLLAGLVLVMPLPAAAADFTLRDIYGDEHTLSAHRGKWVVVNYWATWCPPCLEEIPDLILFHEKHKDSDAVVLGVNMQEASDEKLQAFAREHRISYPLLRADGRNGKLGLVLGLPTTYLVDPGGDVAVKREGPVTGKSIEEFIADWKAQPVSGGAGTVKDGGPP